MAVADIPLDKPLYEEIKSRLVSMIKAGNREEWSVSRLVELTGWPQKEASCALADLAAINWFRTRYVSVTEEVDGHTHSTRVTDKYWRHDGTRDGIEVNCDDCSEPFMATPSTTFVSYTPHL